jgi:hypothetical protein
MAFNPYSSGGTDSMSGEEPEYPDLNNRYAAPTLESGSPYNDEFGWAPSMRLSPEAIPDTARLAITPNRESRPDATRPDVEWYGPQDNNTRTRESVTDQNAVGWQELKGVSPGDQRWAPNPRLNYPAEPRPTQQLSPRSYSFTRPFGWGNPKDSSKHLNGLHFSMADHRRNYEIYGMQPVTSRRNTYRLEPQPWDTSVVDLPPDQETVSSRIQSVEVENVSRARGWRLQ